MLTLFLPFILLFRKLNHTVYHTVRDYGKFCFGELHEIIEHSKNNTEEFKEVVEHSKNSENFLIDLNGPFEFIVVFILSAFVVLIFFKIFIFSNWGLHAYFYFSLLGFTYEMHNLDISFDNANNKLLKEDLIGITDTPERLNLIGVFDHLVTDITIMVTSLILSYIIWKFYFYLGLPSVIYGYGVFRYAFASFLALSLWIKWSILNEAKNNVNNNLNNEDNNDIVHTLFEKSQNGNNTTDLFYVYNDFNILDIIHIFFVDNIYIFIFIGLLFCIYKYNVIFGFYLKKIIKK